MSCSLMQALTEKQRRRAAKRHTKRRLLKLRDIGNGEAGPSQAPAPARKSMRVLQKRHKIKVYLLSWGIGCHKHSH